jgi:hypothetical protein
MFGQPCRSQRFVFFFSLLFLGSTDDPMVPSARALGGRPAAFLRRRPARPAQRRGGPVYCLFFKERPRALSSLIFFTERALLPCEV